MAQTVIGFFEEAAAAQAAMQQLERAGLLRQQVDVRTSAAADASNVSGDSGRETDEQNRNGMKRFFNSLFGNDSAAADRFAQVGTRDGYIVTIHAQSSEQAEKAAALLDKYGAIDVVERARQEGDSPLPTPINHSEQPGSSEHQPSAPIVQEKVDVGERRGEQDNRRMYSRMVELPAEQQVQVERQPVDRPVTDVELRLFQEGDIELTERAEVPIINKEARVVEEIRVRRDVRERGETIRDSVRHTEVDVEQANRNATRRGDG